MKVVVLLLLAIVIPGQASITGKVVDARGGEGLARVRVRIAETSHETQTNSSGVFSLPDPPPGEYVLHVETVGYRLARERFTASERSQSEFLIVLTPETLARTDSVDVTSRPFETGTAPSPSEHTLTGTEVKNLGSVLMDDPVRAVHALPGVAANNDFQSRFTVRGAGFERIGLYIDDVLVRSPFHSIGADEGDASLSILNGEMVGEMSLIPSAFPARFSDRTAGALDIHTREGTRSRHSIRLAAGVASSSVLAEGPVHGGRGSWIASARKSYLQYLVSRVSTETSLGIGFTDVQGRLAYSLAKRHSLYLHVLDGNTDLDRTRSIGRSGVNALIEGRTRSTVARAGWEYTAPRALIVRATGAFLRERLETLNRDQRVLDDGLYGEWIGTVRAVWQARQGHSLDGSWTTRRLRDGGASNVYFNDHGRILQLDTFRGVALRHGSHAEYAWTAGRLRGAAGIRWDRHEYASGAPASPVASLAVRLLPGMQFQIAAGQYVQFPELAVLTSPYGRRDLLPERANHVTTAIEQRIGDNTRIRAEAWNRDDRDLLMRPLFDPRLIGGALAVSGDARVFNSVRGYSRGGQVTLQRRSANRLSGWISYTYSFARQRDSITGQHYWSAFDQRHIGNAYVSYRWRPSLNLSARYGYGSGEPIPGFLTQRDGLYYLSAQRNAQRLPSYGRFDVRANKSFTFDRWKLTLYGEVINVTNRRNLRFVSLDGASSQTGQARLTIERVFPIVPVAGVTLEF